MDWPCMDCRPRGSGRKFCSCRKCIARYGRHPSGGANCAACRGTGVVTCEASADTEQRDPDCSSCGHVESDHRPQIDGGSCGAPVDDDQRCGCRR